MNETKGGRGGEKGRERREKRTCDTGVDLLVRVE